MPDIAMCTDDSCPSAKKCYRHEATPDKYHQVYAEFERRGKDKCGAFMEALDA